MNLNKHPASINNSSIMLFNGSSVSNSTGNSPQLGSPGAELLMAESSQHATASHSSAREDPQQQKRHNLEQLQLLQQQQQQQQPEEVKQVELYGVRIVALTISGRERLCLAQISNTLLKEFSYNEIHNRRVALGITCVQCTPIQLEMLRRAGAMPSSSRRCGMITMREAERLCRSFLVEEQPPDLPENFYFTVSHRVNYGCKGRFVPARYISSRAKCIECFYCGEYYSPNKFIFHSHRHPQATDCNPPDSPNINSWRKHIDLDWSQEHSQEIKYAWEDVKSLFNGGTRRRTPAAGSQTSGGARSSLVRPGATLIKSEKLVGVGEHEQLIDVEDLGAHVGDTINCQQEMSLLNNNELKGGQLLISDRRGLVHRTDSQLDVGSHHSALSILNHISSTDNQHVASAAAAAAATGAEDPSGGSVLRRFPGLPVANQPPCKRLPPTYKLTEDGTIESPTIPRNHSTGHTGEMRDCFSAATPNLDCLEPPSNAHSVNVHPPMRELMAPISNSQQANNNNNINPKCNLTGLMYPNTSGGAFSIYGQLYSQLIQHQPATQLMPVETQLALRHHLWTSLLTNLQARGLAANQQTYAPPTNRAPMHSETSQPQLNQHHAPLQHLNHLMPTGLTHHQYHQKQQQKQPNLQNQQFTSGSE